MSTTIEVNPDTIKDSVKLGEQYKKTLTIDNKGKERSSYLMDLSAEKAPFNWESDFDPNEFALDPDTAQHVNWKLQIPGGFKIGTYRFKIKVANGEKDDDKVEIPVVLKVFIPLHWWITIGVVLLVIILIILIGSRAAM